jgi:acetate---CoA ligase (ADP-forming)
MSRPPTTAPRNQPIVRWARLIRVSAEAPSKVAGLDRVLRPRSVAVLGASSRPGALSSRFITGLQRHGFSGRIVPVNPARDVIDGLPCAPSIAAAAADEPIDLAVVSLPQSKVLTGIEECAEAGVGGAVIFSSGFSEVGEEGAHEERRITEVTERTGLRVVGPNSPGLINRADSTCVIASGVGFRPSFASGGISLLAQSGGVAGLLVERSQDAGAGLSVAVCTGNEADLKVGELLWWLADHEPTKVVGIFLEGIRDPETFAGGLDALRAVGKPVVVLKAGATAAAARASAAHTGALATEDDVVGAFLARHGAVRVYGFDDLIDTCVALERLGPASTRGVGILTTSGGAGVISTEAAERAGLELPDLRPGTRERLAAVVPDFAALSNPVDMSGMFSEKPEIFHESLRAFTEAEEFGTAVLVLTVHRPEDSERLADLVLGADAANLAVLWTAGAMSLPSRRRLSEAGLAVFEDAARCMRALAARAEAGTAPPGDVPPPALELDLPSDAEATETEALTLLAAAGVPTAPTVLCRSANDARAAGAELGAGPFVVKASARDLPHKSDAGAVVLGVSGPDEVAAAYERVVEAARAAGADPEGAVVQAMAPEGIELIVGARRDPVLGPVLVVGPGGLLAELAPQVSRRMLPLRAGEARAMLDELSVAPLLHGYRGAPEADFDAAVAAIEGVAAVALAAGERLEAVEVNPLLVHPRGAGATAVDALLLQADIGQ